MLHKPVTHPHLSYFSSPLLFFFSIMRERERERLGILKFMGYGSDDQLPHRFHCDILLG